MDLAFQLTTVTFSTIELVHVRSCSASVILLSTEQ